MKKLAFGVIALTVVGCGGKGPTAPGPFAQTVAGTVSSFGYTSHAVNAPRAGVMTATLSWSSSFVDLDLYLTASTCADVYVFGCTRLASSDRANGTSESITRTVSAGEQYKLWVDSFSAAPQNYTLQIRIE